MSIGIIGLGVVGGAMYRGFKQAGLDVFGYDIDPARSQNSIGDALSQKVILISLPTPVDQEGRCDLSAIYSVFDYAAAHGATGSLVLRSTVPVGTTDQLIGSYPGLKIGFSPEFLRKATADFDFLNPAVIIYGGHDAGPYFEAMNAVCKKETPRSVLSTGEAEMVKLFLNGFAAVKAVFSSELARFAQGVNMDWDKVVAAAQYDGRLGEGYLSGIGSDGLPGVGGQCLPKDCLMLINQLGSGSLLENVLKINAGLRAS